MNATPFPTMNLGVTILTEEQIWGDAQGNGQLQVMKDYGTKCGMSDLTAVLGGYKGSYLRNIEQHPSAHIWTASCSQDGHVRSQRSDGNVSFGDDPNIRSISTRPVLPASVVSCIDPSEIKFKRTINNIQVLEYGEYPQTLAPENVALEVAFSKGILQTTGKTYTFDGESIHIRDEPFKAKKYEEYKIHNRRFIRVEAQPSEDRTQLLNGKIPQKGEPCWIEVQPIEWLKDDESGIMIARHALFAGVQFDCIETYDGDFSKTDIKHYLDTYFAKEMQVGRTVDYPATIINPNSVMLSEDRAAQRKRALNDPSQGL